MGRDAEFVYAVAVKVLFLQGGTCFALNIGQKQMYSRKEENSYE